MYKVKRMKRDELQELKHKQKEDLLREAREKQVRLRTLRFDLAAGKVKNAAEIRKIRKDIAQILTVYNAKNENV